MAEQNVKIYSKENGRENAVREDEDICQILFVSRFSLKF